MGAPPDNQANPGTLPNGLALNSPGQPLALYSGYATGIPYSEFKFGFDGSGNGLITLDSVGGSPLSCNFSINGVLTPCGGGGGTPALPLGSLQYNAGGTFGGYAVGSDFMVAAATLNLSTTGVTAGTYTSITSITVDSKGRVLAIAGSMGAGGTFSTGTGPTDCLATGTGASDCLEAN